MIYIILQQELVPEVLTMGGTYVELSVPTVVNETCQVSAYKLKQPAFELNLPDSVNYFSYVPK